MKNLNVKQIASFLYFCEIFLLVFLNTNITLQSVFFKCSASSNLGIKYWKAIIFERIQNIIKEFLRRLSKTFKTIQDAGFAYFFQNITGETENNKT